MRVVGRLGVAAIAATVVASVLAGHVDAAAMRVAATHHATRVLYQADWTKAHGGWHLGPGFSVKSGKLVFDGSNQTGNIPALAPFTTSAPEIAIVATFHVQPPTNQAGSWFGILAQAQIGKGIHFQYERTALNIFTQTPTAMPELEWFQGPNEGIVPAHGGVDPTGTHTMRGEIRGSFYRLLLDGKQVVGWTPLSEGTPGGLLGISGSGVPFTVTSFRVIRLKSRMVTARTNPDTLSTHALALADARATVGATYYFDDWWLGGSSTTGAAALKQAGVQYGLIEMLETADKTWDLEQTLLQFESADQAEAYYRAAAARNLDPANIPPTSQVADISSLGLPDPALAITGTFQSSGKTLYAESVIIEHGAYVTEVVLNATSQAILQAQVTADVPAADRHLQG